MTNSTRTIDIVLDTSGVDTGVSKINRSLLSIGPAAKGAEGNVNGLSNAFKAANDNANRSSNSILNFAKGLGKATIATSLLGAAIAALAALGAIFTGLADKASAMEAKLRLATKTTQEYARASADVVRIAFQTRSELGSVTALYTKMAANARTLGLNTAGVGTATRTFGMALKISGASAQEAESSILQLSQAMASGVLAGDEFKSLAENSPVFMGILASSMNVPIGALKKLGSEGKITGQQIAQALTDPKIVADIESKFAKIPTTFGDVMTTTRNILVQGAGALFKGLGIEQALGQINGKIFTFGQSALPVITAIGAKIKQAFTTMAPVVMGVFNTLKPIIVGIATNLDSIAKVAISVGASFLVMKASLALSGAIAQVVQLGVSLGATGGFAAFSAGAMGLFSAGVRMATGAVNGFTVALLANPVTAIAVALTGTIALLYQFRDAIKLGSGEFATIGDLGRVIFGDIGKAVKGFADVAKQVFAAVGTFFKTNFGPLVALAKQVFGNINVSIFGVLQVVATVVGGVVGHFIGMGNMARSIFSSAVQAVAAGVVGIANAAISAVEGMINNAINGINGLIAMADAIPMVEIGVRLAPVAIGRIAGPEMPTFAGAARDAASGYMDGQRSGQAGRRYLDDAGRRADALGRGRGGRGGAAPGVTPPGSDTAPPPTNAMSGAKDAAGGAADEAERAATAIKDFWDGLEKTRDAAGLVGFELEKHNASLELAKLLNREITEAEGTRLTTLLRETATRKAIAELTQSATDNARKSELLAQRGLLLGTMSTERVNEEMAIREAMASRRAQYDTDGVDRSNEELNLLLRQEEVQLRQLAIDERRQRVQEDRIKTGQGLIERYSREANPALWAGNDRTERDTAINAAMGARPDNISVEIWQRAITDALTGSANEYNTTMTGIASAWRERMLGGIDQIADAFGGKLGEVIRGFGTAFDSILRSASGDQSKNLFGGIATLFGGKEGQRNGFGQAFDQSTAGFSKDALSAAFSKPMESLTSSFGKFQDLFKKGGSFTNALGSLLGAAGQGSAVGSAVAGVGKMLWKGFNETGSQIGGMIGSMVGGPIGSIIGSIGGGIIGGLFSRKKKPTASSSITMGAEGLTSLTTGNNKAAEGEAGNASQSVISGINAIASRLGGNATGNANVSIGKYKNEWKVGTNGQAVGKKSGQSFGEDAEAAIRFAIQDAIRDGVITGLSAFSDRVLRSATNLDSAVSLAESYEKLLKDLANFKDPLGASIRETTDNLDKLVKMMKGAGASSEELSKVEEYKKLKLDAILKDQLGSLTDFKRELNGEGSGVSAFSRLSVAQSEFAKLFSTIKSGGNVDQDTFTSTGQEVLSLARDVFGTSSSQFQAIRAMLIEATDGAINNVTKQFDNATVQAITAQTDAVVGEIALTNDLLAQLLARQGGGAIDFGGGSRVVNGRVVSNAA